MNIVAEVAGPAIRVVAPACTVVNDAVRVIDQGVGGRGTKQQAVNGDGCAAGRDIHFAVHDCRELEVARMADPVTGFILGAVP